MLDGTGIRHPSSPELLLGAGWTGDNAKVLHARHAEHHRYTQSLERPEQKASRLLPKGRRSELVR
ncbi:hypothetical protein, partial [Pseudomonas syringae]|uniref:hypothetical protein n=1 Tax=Pseudomonas syringae TaxID=317 RepID=UPI001967FA77